MNKADTPIPKFKIQQKYFLARKGIWKWKIPTHVTGEELIILYKLAKQLKDNSISIEIGSYIGASSLMIAKGLPEKGILYCVDTWQNDAMTEGNKDTYSEFLENTKTVKNKIITIRKKSEEAAKEITTKIDYLFIDGDHSYEGVKTDIKLWFPQLKRGGIIIMHDIGWAEGVIKATEEEVKPFLGNYKQTQNMIWGWKKG